MEVFLFGGAALVAFLFAGAPVLIWAYMRRERQLRAALAESLNRLAEYESEAPTAPRPAPRSQIIESAPPAAPPPESDPAPQPAGEFIWRAPDSPAPQSPPPEPEPEPVAAEPRQPLWRRLAPPRKPETPEPPVIREQSVEPPHAPPATPRTQAGDLAPWSLAALIAVVAAACIVLGARTQMSPALALVLAIFAAAASFASGAWLRRARAGRAQKSGPAVFVATALLIAVAIAIAAHRLFNLAPALVAFAMLAIVAFVAFVQAHAHGRFFFTLGLAVAIAAPAFAPLDPIAVALRHAVLLAALIFALRTPLSAGEDARAHAWPWTAVVGALGWSFEAALTSANAPIPTGAAAANALALAAIGAAIAWPHARAARDLRNTFIAAHPPGFAYGAALMLGAAISLGALVIASQSTAPIAGAALVALAAGLAVAAAYAEGLALIALIAFALTAFPLALWPHDDLDAPALLFTAAALAFAAILGGWLNMARAKTAARGALLAACGPSLVLFAAFLRLGPLGGDDLWALLAASFASLNLLFHLRLRGAKRTKAAASAYALGASLAAAAAISLAAPAPFNLAALGALVLLHAALDRAAKDEGSRLAARLIALAVLPIALAQFFLAHDTWTLASWLDARTLPLLAAASLTALAAHFFAAQSPPTARGLWIAALAIATLALLLAIRTLAAPGDVAARDVRLWELGADALVILAFAAALSLSFGAEAARVVRVTAASAACAAASLALIGAGLAINPWWGLAPAPVIGLPMLNENAAAFALTGLAFLAFGWLCARQGHLLAANLAAAVALGLAFIWCNVELRRLIHAGAMADAPYGFWEAWSFTLLWLACAGLLAALALHRKSRALESAALAVTLAAFVKILLVDSVEIGAAARVGLIALTILAGGASIVLYNRQLLIEAAQRRADPNLLPPA